MIGDWVKLTRLTNALVAGFGVWLGHACLPGSMDWRTAALGFLVLAILVMAGNIHNDILDLPADRINRPQRPLPQGTIAISRAWLGTIVLYLTSLVLAFYVGRQALVLTLSMAALLYLYNLKLKALPLWGNLAVALLCALAVYFPESPLWPTYTGLPALFAFLTTLAREIAKDAEDLPGDTAVGRVTFPIRFGIDKTRWAMRLLIAAILLMLPLPYFWLNYRAGYALLIVLLAVPLLFKTLIDLSQPNPEWAKIQRGLKWIMLAGMLAIFTGLNT